MKLSLVFVIFLLKTLSQSEGLDNGLARTPPMGWSHWWPYKCKTDCDADSDDCVNENLFKRTADLLVSEGYAAAGYKYVIMDDCWQAEERDPVTKKLVADPKRFPSGLQSLAEYIHSRGLKFGLCENYASSTCAGKIGIIDHVKLDAQTFAEWAVDYVKLNGCHTSHDDLAKGYREFGKLLNETGRPMVYACSWPTYLEQEDILPDYTAVKETCNTWRNWEDVTDSYDSIRDIMNFVMENQDRFQPLAGKGQFNDLDILMLGNSGLSYEQSKTQMVVWAVLAAPLIMSNDLRAVRPQVKDILLNRRIIEVNQDGVGVQGRLILLFNKIEVWARPVNPIKNGRFYSFAIAFVNPHKDEKYPIEVSVPLRLLNLHDTQGYKATDLFTGSTMSSIFFPSQNFTTRVYSTDVTFYKFTPQCYAGQPCYIYSVD